MMEVRIEQWESTLAIRLPERTIEALDIKLGDLLSCTVKDGKLELRQTLPELSLEALLAEVEAPFTSEVDWGEPVGREFK